jgi:hypothetical protein
LAPTLPVHFWADEETFTHVDSLHGSQADRILCNGVRIKLTDWRSGEDIFADDGTTASLNTSTPRDHTVRVPDRRHVGPEHNITVDDVWWNDTYNGWAGTSNIPAAWWHPPDRPARR